MSTSTSALGHKSRIHIVSFLMGFAQAKFLVRLIKSMYLQVLGLSVLVTYPGWTQTRVNQDKYQLNITAAEQEIKVDGRLDETSWQVADTAADFWQKSPRDDVKANYQTIARVTYDEHYLYFGFICYDNSTNHVITNLKRDQVWEGDGIGIILDPFNETTNGLLFGVSAAGAQSDAILAGGSGEENYSEEWEGRWFAETYQHTDYWTVEVAIPFKTLRYDAKNIHWGVNFFRNDAKRNQIHSWTQCPRQFWVTDLGFTGSLLWDKAPPVSKSNIAFIPYMSVSIDQDKSSGSNALDADMSFGGDAKVALTPSLNLDLTVNPDFSQVEVDVQQTNLTRFNLFFPERRNFFLENSDLFSGFGIPPVQPFFSRRIGLTEEGQQVPILFGARLTGNVTEDLRVGLLDVQTRNQTEQPGDNFFTAAFSQKIWDRSAIRGLFINRQSTGDLSQQNEIDHYGRNAGLEFRYQNIDGKWNGWSNYHQSFKPGVTGPSNYFNFGGAYTGKTMNYLLDVAHVSDGYYADMGFINRVDQYDAFNDRTIRQGYSLIYVPISATILPKKERRWQSLEIGMESIGYFTNQLAFNEREQMLGAELMFKNTSMLSLGFSSNSVNLLYPFAFTDGQPLPSGWYHFNGIGMEYNSDNRKLFNYEMEFSYGGFYNGTLLQSELEINYRRQPWGQLQVRAQYNKLEFPDPFGHEELWLIGPRLELSFSRNLFFTNFLQYNTQANNFNINSRLQWQFQPLSWIYLVYTDNYATEVWTNKNRALVLKVNYWLNI